MRTLSTRLLAALCVSAAIVLILPGAARAELSAGVARDFFHSTNANAIVLRYDWRATNLGSQAMAWRGSDGTNGAITLDYNILGFSGIPVDLDFGAAYIARTSRENGSNLNFQLTMAVNLWRFRVFFTHFSNAGIAPPNPGWNFAGLAWRF